MSESERMPGYRNRSQVPPMASRASRIAKDLSGHSIVRWQPAPMPDSPAPTTRTSTWVVFTSLLSTFTRQHQITGELEVAVMLGQLLEHMHEHARGRLTDRGFSILR